MPKSTEDQRHPWWDKLSPEERQEWRSLPATRLFLDQLRKDRLSQLEEVAVKAANHSPDAAAAAGMAAGLDLVIANLEQMELDIPEPEATT